MRVKMMSKPCGQVTVETAVLVGFLVAGFVALGLYFQRGVQGYVKSNSDGFGTQFSSAEKWRSFSRSSTEDLKNDVANHVKSTQFTNSCQGVGGKALPDCDPDPDCAVGQLGCDPKKGLAFDPPETVTLP